MDALHACPRQSIHIKQLAKELGHVPEFVGLEAVNGGVLVLKAFIEDAHPCLVEQAQPLPQEPIKSQVGPLLAAALHHH